MNGTFKSNPYISEARQIEKNVTPYRIHIYAPDSYRSNDGSQDIVSYQSKNGSRDIVSYRSKDGSGDIDS